VGGNGRSRTYEDLDFNINHISSYGHVNKMRDSHNSFHTKKPLNLFSPISSQRRSINKISIAGGKPPIYNNKKTLTSIKGNFLLLKNAEI
jgi:hypothetical protein